VLSIGSHRSSLGEFQAVGLATAYARCPYELRLCLGTTRYIDAWQNEDVINWPHERLERCSPSSNGEPCDESSYASTRAWTSLFPEHRINEGRQHDWRLIRVGNWTFRPFFSSPETGFALARIQRFLLIQLNPKHHRLDVFNHSRHSVRMSCRIKRLLTYLLTYGSRSGRILKYGIWSTPTIGHTAIACRPTKQGCKWDVWCRDQDETETLEWRCRGMAETSVPPVRDNTEMRRSKQRLETFGRDSSRDYTTYNV